MIQKKKKKRAWAQVDVAYKPSSVQVGVADKDMPTRRIIVQST